VGDAAAVRVRDAQPRGSDRHPWHLDQRLQPYQTRLNALSDTGRSLVTQMHLHMAQEGNALDD